MRYLIIIFSLVLFLNAKSQTVKSLRAAIKTMVKDDDLKNAKNDELHSEFKVFKYAAIRIEFNQCAILLG